MDRHTKKEYLLRIFVIGLMMTVVGFAIRYSIIDLSTRRQPHGYRGEGMLLGLVGFAFFAYGSIRLAIETQRRD